jgi:RHS repeat-associated protein
MSKLSANQLQMVSTESDPDAFIQNHVNVINGDYCESATDLVIAGPDSLVLQRFYSTKDLITGLQTGGWRILPQRFLVIGRDSSIKPITVGQDHFEWTYALVGERSGGILPYSGWRNTSGITKDPLKINVLDNALGCVNTYAGEMNGQTNHQNNMIHCKGDRCELILGDGTKRIYQRVDALPSRLLGEELTPLMADQMLDPDYFLLNQEILPSGNQLFFSYDTDGHLISIEMKNNALNNIFSWIHFTYDFKETGCQVHIETSDVKSLTYSLVNVNGVEQLRRIEGSHCVPVSYEYNQYLTKKILPEGRFIEIEYQEGKVKCVKSPKTQPGSASTDCSFFYGKDYTDVVNAMGVKTRFLYDNRLQLKSVERYDEKNTLYRVDQKFWGKTKLDAGLLVARTIGDGGGRIYSYRSFQYDKSGNVIEEKLYGNLTGKQEVSLSVTSDGKLLNPDEEECHVNTFNYSSDGYNLLVRVGDCKGNKTRYIYKQGTNYLIKKFIYEGDNIKKRTFLSYNEDGVCIKIIEDDAFEEDASKIYEYGQKERLIKEIKPKTLLPGVGLPEIIEIKASEHKKRREILVKKIVNVYDDQANLLSCSTYDENGQYAFTESKTYNNLGQVTAQIDAAGREVCYTYDEIGNQTAMTILQESKYITNTYDFQNQKIEVNEITPEGRKIMRNIYDSLNRKICTIDPFYNSTHYEYDAFHRLIKIIHPEVLDENRQVIRPTFTYSYNLFDQVTSIKDPKGFITKKSYNLRGDPTKISYADGSYELYKYDVEGSLHRALSRNQIVSIYEYDYLGRCVQEENSAAGERGTAGYLSHRKRQYNGFRCVFEEEGNCLKRYYFDPAGRLSSFVTYDSGKGENHPDSLLTEIAYDPLGYIKQKKVWFDAGPNDYSLECFEYDLLGNIIEKKVEDASGNVLLRKSFSYNSQGHCTEEYSLENGRKTSLIKTFYNSHGEPTCFIDGCGQETKIIIDNSYQNNLGQNVLKKTLVNPFGVQTEIEFDALSRVTCITKKDPFGVLLSLQKILYDSLGNKASEINDDIVEGKILGSQENQWIYGPMGRLEVEVKAANTPLEQRILYTYNSLGQMTSRSIAGLAGAINYSYDEKNRTLRKVEVQDSNRELNVLNTYQYDFKGNLWSAKTIDGCIIQKHYDVFNRVIKEIVNDVEGIYTLQYDYDRKGRLKNITLPDSSKIIYGYDAVFGRKVKRISADGKVQYKHTYDQYDEQGKLLSESYMDNVGSIEYRYDLNGQKIECKSESYHEEYSRDALGRIVEIKGDKSEEYSYNALSQLITEKKASTKAYAYNSLDDRIKADSDELFYNTLNQLTSSSKAEFSYDPQGNLLRKVIDGQEMRFSHNLLSQLVSTESTDKTKRIYSYDPFGRILGEKHLDSAANNQKTLSTTRYLYLGHEEIGTLSKKGKIETLKIPGLNGDELGTTSVAFELNGTTYVPIHDIAGNVVRLIDPDSNQSIESYQYTAFGEETILNTDGEVVQCSALGNPWRFAEKRVDPKTGFILFGFRIYDPAVGRWISQDPAGFIDGPNLYAYLHNNPLSYYDRFGLSTEANDQNKFGGYFYGQLEPLCYCEKHRTCKRGGDLTKTKGNQLPTVTYCDEFEKVYANYGSEAEYIATRDLYDEYRPYYEPSKIYDLSSEGLLDLPDMELGYINGINTTFLEAKKNAMHLSKLAGGCNIHAVYNATHGSFIDLIECRMGLNHIATDPVRQLHKMWNDFFARSSKNSRYLMICHSQGAIHVMNALLDYPPELRDRILVVAIAPGGYIYRESCHRVVHYRAKASRDGVPRIDQKGAEREKDTIIELDSHPDAPLFDHKFTSPTYRDQLAKRTKRYIKSQGKEI